MSADNHTETSSDEEEETFVQMDQGNWMLSDSSDEEEERATREEVFGVAPAVETTREQPPDIDVGAGIADIKLHPSRNIIIAATLDNEVVSYKYNNEETEELESSEHHDRALTSVCFNKDGTSFYTSSSDCSAAVLDTQTFEVKWHNKEAHEQAVSCVAHINDNLFATGDDYGILKVWDLRTKKEVCNKRCSEETIRSIISDDEGKFVIAADNEGALTVFNFKKSKLKVQSEPIGSPFTCMAAVRTGTRLAVGAENGRIYLYNWGEFGLHSDRLASEGSSINCMVPIGNNRVITGSADDSIRAVNFFPHRFIGNIGSHGDCGIEAVTVCHEKRYLASSSHDECIKFWDLKHLHSISVDPNAKSKKTVDLKNNLLSSRKRNRNDFFADIEDGGEGTSDDQPRNVQDITEEKPESSPEHNLQDITEEEKSESSDAE